MVGKLSTPDKKALEKFIKDGPKSFKLLYSFSQNGAQSATFHQKCDNKGPTVTVIYNTEGSVYGGYTEKTWAGSESYIADDHAFLFRLKYNNKVTTSKFPVKSPEHAICCHAAHGPIFGSGHDLHTFSGSLPLQGGYYTMNGSTQFGSSYDMCGVSASQITNDKNTVTDLEVYSVSDSVISVWREIPGWDLENLEELKNEVDSYCPSRGIGIKSAKILFLGSVGAGKSSFFNTISSVFRGHVTGQAVCGNAEQSITSKYRVYHVRGSAHTKPLKFRICDTRGIEENQGIDGTELSYLLEGNVPDGYQFNPSTPISPDIPGFVSTPKLNDKIHCVCFVIDGSTATVMSEKMLEKIKSLQMKVRQKGLPQIVLLTKVDNVCPLVEEDITNVFQSESIRDLVDTVSGTLGVPRSHVLPIKNYEKEIDVKQDVSILALLSLRQILRAAEDFMFNYLDDLEDSENNLDFQE